MQFEIGMQNSTVKQNFDILPVMASKWLVNYLFNLLKI